MFEYFNPALFIAGANNIGTPKIRSKIGAIIKLLIILILHNIIIQFVFIFRVKLSRLLFHALFLVSVIGFYFIAPL